MSRTATIERNTKETAKYFTIYNQGACHFMNRRYRDDLREWSNKEYIKKNRRRHLSKMSVSYSLIVIAQDVLWSAHL